MERRSNGNDRTDHGIMVAERRIILTDSESIERPMIYINEVAEEMVRNRRDYAVHSSSVR